MLPINPISAVDAKPTSENFLAHLRATFENLSKSKKPAVKTKLTPAVLATLSDSKYLRSLSFKIRSNALPGFLTNSSGFTKVE
jgi:hypothetical protein